MEQFFKNIILLNNVLRLDRIYVDSIIKLLNDHNVDYVVSLANKPVKYNIRLTNNIDTDKHGILEVNTDDYCFGFINNNLSYVVVNCDKEIDFMFMDENGNKIKAYDMFNMFSMLRSDISELIDNSYKIIEICEDSGVIIKVARFNNSWYLSFEFYRVSDLVSRLHCGYKPSKIY